MKEIILYKITQFWW